MKKFSFKENYELIALFDPIPPNLIAISRKLKNHPKLDSLILEMIAISAQFSLRMYQLQTDESSNEHTTSQQD